MEISVAHQTLVFLASAVLGALLFLIYDGLFVLRLLLRAKTVLTFLTDSLFCLLSAAVLFAFVVFVAHGEVRAYLFLGMLFGCILYGILIKKPAQYLMLALAKTAVGATAPLRQYCKRRRARKKQQAFKQELTKKNEIKSKKLFPFLKK